MNLTRRRVIIGLACMFVAVAALGALLSSPKKLGSRPASDFVLESSSLAHAMFRRGMIDAASNRFMRARRAFDAARRAAKNDAELLQRIDIEAAKLKAVSRKGDVR